MQGSTYKRCPCPPRRDARGRRVPCGKAHGSWSYKVDLPREAGQRRQFAKGGFATKREAEQAMAELIARAARGPVVQVSRQSLGEYLTSWLEVIWRRCHRLPGPTTAPASTGTSDPGCPRSRWGRSPALP